VLRSTCTNRDISFNFNKQNYDLSVKINLMDGSSLIENSWSLRLTDIPLSRCEKLAHFNHKDIPQGGRILNIGSGLYQTFEKELKKNRPDLEIVSIDPSLIEKDFLAENSEVEKVKPDSSQRLQALSNKENTVIAIGQRLPFPDNVFDMSVDIHGPAQYSKDEETYKKYLKEAVRVLKPGGKLHIFNTYFGDPLLGNSESEKDTVNMQRRIFNELGFNAEIFVQTERIVKDKNGKDVEDKRIGVIITKAP